MWIDHALINKMLGRKPAEIEEADDALWNSAFLVKPQRRSTDAIDEND